MNPRAEQNAWLGSLYTSEGAKALEQALEIYGFMPDWESPQGPL